MVINKIGNLFRNHLKEDGVLEKVATVIRYKASRSYQGGVEDRDGQIFITQTVGPLLSQEDRFVWGDPFALRDAFEVIKSPTEAARFLSECGSFLPMKGSVLMAKPYEPWRVTWQQFQAIQEHFRERRRGSNKPSLTKTELGLDTSLLHPYPRLDELDGRLKNEGVDYRKHLTLWVECSYALEAISALIEMNNLNNVLEKQCENKNCPLPGRWFEMGTRGDRKYCEPRCQHAARERVRKPERAAEKAQAAAKLLTESQHSSTPAVPADRAPAARRHKPDSAIRVKSQGRQVQPRPV